MFYIQILHIEGAITKAAAPSFYKPTNNLVPFELLIRKTTSITNLRVHVVNQNINYDHAQQVTFGNLGKVTGLIGKNNFKYILGSDIYHPNNK